MNVSTNQVADSLEKRTEHGDEYMISEKELFVNKYVFFLPPVKTLTEICWSKSFALAAAPPPQDRNKL